MDWVKKKHKKKQQTLKKTIPSPSMVNTQTTQKSLGRSSFSQKLSQNIFFSVKIPKVVLFDIIVS